MLRERRWGALSGMALALNSARCLCLILLLSLSLPHLADPLPGIRLSLFPHGIAQLDKVTANLIANQLPRLLIPNIEHRLPTDQGVIRISQIRFSRFRAASSHSLRTIAPNRMVLDLHDMTIGLLGHLSGWTNIVVQLDLQGEAEVFVEGLHLHLEVVLEKWHGSARILVPSCSSSIDAVQVLNHNGGLFGLVVSVFKQGISENVRNLLERVICKEVKKYIDQELNTKLAEVQTRTKLNDAIRTNSIKSTRMDSNGNFSAFSNIFRQDFGRDFYIDYRLVENPSCGDNQLNIGSSGEISLKGEGGTPFQPTRMPIPSTNHSMMGIAISDYIPNSMFYHAFKEDRLRIYLDRSMSGVSDFLRTWCPSGVCLADAIPQLADVYPNSSLSMLISATRVPSMVFLDKDGGLIQLAIVGLVVIYLDGQHSRRQIIGMNMDLIAELKVVMKNDLLRGIVRLDKFSLSKRFGELNVSNGDLDDVSLLGSHVIENMLNDVFSMGFPLPVPSVVHLHGVHVHVLSRYLLLTSSFSLDEHRLSRLASTVLFGSVPSVRGSLSRLLRVADPPSTMRILTIHILFIAAVTEGAELTRCCSGGARHYIQTSTCSGIKSEGSTLFCHRTASICCLRALLDDSCDQGVVLAKDEGTCPTHINMLGGGLQKECCDCCSLAKDLVARNLPCAPATGFSSLCLKSFNKCCMASIEVTANGDSTALADRSETPSFHFGDRCSSSRCEHLCNDRGGREVECSCRSGYDLAADGISCVDINECSLGLSPCDPIRDVCQNTPGAYECLPRDIREDNKIIPSHREKAKRREGMGIMRDDPRKYQPRNINEERRSEPEYRRSETIKREPHGTQMRNENRAVTMRDDSRRKGELRREETRRNGEEPLRRMRDEPREEQTRMNNDALTIECPPGWQPANGTCVDIDECLLLMYDCLESQRCLNTPGSFKCIRTLSCGTGYALDSETEQCMDVDECTLGSHDCGPLYRCKNTQGSYRCHPKTCSPEEFQNPITGECTKFDCPKGYEPKDGKCVGECCENGRSPDVNECLLPNQCLPTEECFNTPGGLRCQLKGSLCSVGYELNQHTGFCDDINECASPSACGGLPCTNLPGSFKCRCLAGFEFNEQTKKCEDINECEKFAGHVCDALATCQNTIGSFKCKCKKGFELAVDGRHCIDVDECSRGLANCSQKCLNIPGSFQCICERGYTLTPDGRHCQDIDECAVWTSTGSDLCMGGCINIPGGYKCKCPPGYNIQPDGRTCTDIDECLAGECSGKDRVCVNTLGHFKCHQMSCPPNYQYDKGKNRCVRGAGACGAMSDEECQKRMPVHVTYQYIGIPRHVPISLHRPSITLFTIRGPSHGDSIVKFELLLNNTIVEAPGVIPAVRANFLLQKGSERNTAVVALRDSLDGPQQIDLQLILRFSRHSHFTATYLANLIVHVSAHKKQTNLFN